MAGGKQTPRQKMINMMYLVLTALLALNISKDILQALTKLDLSLQGSVATVDAKNSDIYRMIDAAARENPAKAAQWKKMADNVKSSSNQLVDDIEQMKTELIEVSGGTDEETGLPSNLDQREKPANYLLNQKNAEKLKAQIDKYRNELLQYTKDDPTMTANIKAAFDTGKQKVGKDGVEVDWEHANFEHFPLAAILPFLTDIQAKVRNNESDVISMLRARIGGEDIKVSTVMPVVVPNSTYITQGDEYEAKIYLAAYDDTQDPEITIGGQPLPAEQISGGVGVYKVKANSVGQVKWGGKITLKQIGGDKTFDIPEQTFNVAPPTAVISATKMNVFYRGVDNPLEIGVPGVDPSKVRVSGPGVSGSNGKYSANVTNISGTDLKITVSVEEEDGVRTIGSKDFRIKGLPPAVGSIYKKTEGLMSKSLIKNAKVEAEYQDFPFDLPLTVTSFEIAIPGFPPEQVRGNSMPGPVKDRIDRLRPGQTVSIRDIKASGPNGLRVTRIGNISMDVN